MVLGENRRKNMERCTVGSNQINELERLEQSELQNSNDWMEYWFKYSSFDHWQFWVNLLMLVIPLVLLFIFIKREKALLIGFFGYNVHIIFTYIDLYGTKRALWGYPFKVQPFIPSGVALDISLVPVSFMLLYQWVMEKKRNYYVYMIILSGLFAFIIKPLLTILELFQLDRGTNYFHLFLLYILIGVLSKWITNLFILAEKVSKKQK